jgi:predicted signal transduction protein with EAL and GGDEF domain
MKAWIEKWFGTSQIGYVIQLLMAITVIGAIFCVLHWNGVI